MLKVVILANEMDNDHLPWCKACDMYNDQIVYRVVNLLKNDWLENIQQEKFDIIFAKPSGLISDLKQAYDERLYILVEGLGYKVFPSINEIFVYENKRMLSYWLKAHNVPHPVTNVFYTYNEAKSFVIKSNEYLVAKTNIGASGSGVFILKDRKEKLKYIKKTFKGKGAPRRSGPNLSKGNIFIRGLYYLGKPKQIINKLYRYRLINKDNQSSFVLFQKFVPHEFEWRVVRIGDSFFAHKKLKIKDKASGSTIKNYDNPPLDLLDFVYELTTKFGFYSQAVDVFSNGKEYLINEMQCIFGQSDSYQMLIDKKEGRYLYLGGKWIFEEGAFAENACYNLRIKYILDKWNKGENIICK